MAYAMRVGKRRYVGACWSNWLWGRISHLPSYRRVDRGLYAVEQQRTWSFGPLRFSVVRDTGDVIVPGQRLAPTP